jgi:hypothetical protein
MIRSGGGRARPSRGRPRSLRNIYDHSLGDYDFSYNEHQTDTWLRCGHTMNAGEFGNYIAGFEGAAYDQYYFWTTGAVNAQTLVEGARIYYHITGQTKAPHDPFDLTGLPHVFRGERDGWQFGANRSRHNCRCSNP